MKQLNKHNIFTDIADLLRDIPIQFYGYPMRFRIKCGMTVLLCGIILLTSCAKENDALVNPPLISETVNIRFLNFAGDEMPKTLVLEREVRFENIPFGTLSQPQNPPIDSVIIQVFSGNNLEHEREQRQKFSRNTKCIFVAVPSRNDKPEFQNVDSVAIIQTTILPPADTNQCYIKFLNLNNDSKVSYSVKLGCPNGENLFSVSTFNFLQSSGAEEIFEGKRVVSIVKNTPQSESPTKLIGIFELDLKRLGQYVLIVNKFDEVYFIDELAVHQALPPPLQSIEERNAHIRIVNLSSDMITVSKTPGDELATNLNPNFIDEYNTISTCDATTLDKIILTHYGVNTDSLFLSFDVFQKYSIFAFDKTDAKAARIIAVPPVSDRMLTKPDSAIIRVINGNYENSGITVSVGSREANNDFGYSSPSEETLTVNLQEGEISNEIYLKGGNNVPIAVFTSTQPTRYLFSSNIRIEDGKEYVIAVDFSDGLGRLVAIEKEEELAPITFAPQSAFVQIVNVIEGINQVSFNIPNLIENGKMTYSNFVATFVPLGNNSLTINGKTHNFVATRDERILVIASNNANNTDIFSFQSPFMGANSSRLRHRFINASFDTPILQVNTDTFSVFREDIFYQSTTAPISQNRERKYTFFFSNQEVYQDIYQRVFQTVYQTNVSKGDSIATREANLAGRRAAIRNFAERDNPGAGLLRVGDLLMTFNKNYSIIFHGNRNSGYGITVVQEY